MKHFFYLLLFWVPFSLMAQEKKQVHVTGKIIDAQNQQALEFATISFKSLTKPDFITGGVSNSEGNFNIEVPADDYTIQIAFLSFQTHEIKSKQINADVSLGTITLQADAAMIDELEVVGEKTEMEFHLDKKVFNVGKDLLSKGGSANDLLENIPSVTVGVDGAINLRGNANVQILINGKPSMLTANNALDQIPASSIESVEVITNPSARYEAQGTAGIINIILKKNKLEGWSGSIQLRAGTPSDNQPLLNLNYKHKKFNIFSTVGYREADYYNNLISNQTSDNQGIEESLLQLIDTKRSRTSSNYFLGGDYYFDDNNTLTLSAFHYRNHSDHNSDLSYDYKDELLNPTSNLVRTENYQEPQRYNQWEANYTRNFKQKGKKFTFTAKYDFWNDDENERITSQETYPIEEEMIQIKSRDLESSKDLLIQSDLVLPVSESTTLEMGIRGETRIITSDYLAESNANGGWEVVNDFNNELDYYEKIGGAYFQLGKKLEKFSYLLGLRTEYTAIRIEDIRDQYNIEKNYLRFFPTVHLTYKSSETQTIQLSYSRRISRPSFWQLNPFGGITDFRNLRGGNPDLDPSYTNVLEIGLLNHGEKFTFNPSVYYQLSTDYFQSVTEQTTDGNFWTSHYNLDQETRLGVEVATTYNPLAWLTLSGNFNFYRISQQGNYEELNFDNTNETWTARISSRMKLPQSINLQASFNYQGKNVNAQVTRKALNRLDIAVSKDFLKDKASLALNVRNVLDNYIFKWTTTGDSFTQKTERKPFGRRWALTFTYRFNQKKSQRERRPSGSNR